MKRTLMAATALLALSACGQKQEAAGSKEDWAPAAMETSSADASADSEAGALPKIDASIAPGVAFDFSYAFSLPEAKIAEAQEGHAALCGRLGVSRCRVTGLNFSKERGGEVSAMMAFKLDPAIALSFGRDATELVERADGTLETSNVKGEDVGSTIVAGDKSADGLRADLKRIEAQLAIPKLSSSVRQQLMEEARDIRNQIANLKSSRDDQVESLATTPVIFTYEPSEAVLGFQRGSAVQTGLSAGATSMSAVMTTLAFVLGAFGPWLLLGGVGFWAWRRFRTAKKAPPEG